MAAIFEPEETIGRFWHRLVGSSASYPHHPEAAVELDEMRTRLAVLFRALGGDGGVRLTAGSETGSGHRLRLRQRLGLGTERLVRPSLDGDALELPARLDLFAERADNERLYEWLVAFFAHAGPAPPRPADPLQADAAALRQSAATTARALAAWPGLRSLHDDLARAVAALRPQRRLPAWEAAVERAVRQRLGAAAEGDGQAGAILDERVPLEEFRAPRGYRPFLPVPLWGEVRESAPAPRRDGEPDNAGPGGGAVAKADRRRRKAARRASDQAQRNDPLLLNRFEKIIALAEMVNVNRGVDDDDPEAARQAAEDLDEISLGTHTRPTATRLKLDLDLGAEAVDPAPLPDTILSDPALTYPEWDWKRGVYHPAHCRVIAGPADEEGLDWQPDAAALRRIRQVRRQFEALRPRCRILPGQVDGDELDMAALVRCRADLRAGGSGTDRIWRRVRNDARDLAVAVLVDVSLSTDAWVENRRVLDVEKEALLALSHGLWACGDDHAIFTFTSLRRNRVSVRTVKDFDEPLTATVARRVQALKPGHYTRMGAALRHVAARLEERPNRHRLILLLTDGKPNDIDHYEGRYALEDTRRAIRDARRRGLTVFGVTIDAEAHDYVPYLFGRGACAIFPHVSRLAAALPAIYRQIAA